MTGNESNPDTTGAEIKVQPLAQYQGQLDPDPNHDFDAVDQQIFNGDTSQGRVATMKASASCTLAGQVGSADALAGGAGSPACAAWSMAMPR